MNATTETSATSTVFALLPMMLLVLWLACL